MPLVQAAQNVLELDATKRTRTLLRVDAGGGSLDDVNWALSRGYQILCKEYSGQRARLLAATVTRRVDDPEEVGRQVGWVEQEAREYVRPVVRIAVRKRKPNGQWGVAVLISSLLPAEVEDMWLFIWSKRRAKHAAPDKKSSTPRTSGKYSRHIRAKWVIRPMMRKHLEGYNTPTA